MASTLWDAMTLLSFLLLLLIAGICGAIGQAIAGVEGASGYDRRRFYRRADRYLAGWRARQVRYSR